MTLSDAERAADMCTITNTLQAEDMGERLKTREGCKRYGDDVNNPRRKEVRVALLELRGFVYEMISQQRNWCTRTNLKGQQQFFLQEMGERRKYQTKASGKTKAWEGT